MLTRSSGPLCILMLAIGLQSASGQEESKLVDCQMQPTMLMGLSLDQVRRTCGNSNVLRVNTTMRANGTSHQVVIGLSDSLGAVLYVYIENDRVTTVQSRGR